MSYLKKSLVGLAAATAAVAPIASAHEGHAHEASQGIVHHIIALHHAGAFYIAAGLMAAFASTVVVRRAVKARSKKG